jgi:ubiquinone/menaquinone biosynthesis C-methylase UbiE
MSERYFDRMAEQWDSLRGGYFDEGVRESAIARAALRPEMVVADIGTGTGFMLIGLAPLVRCAYGFDSSAEMLRVAQSNLDAKGIANVELRQADGLTLPLGDDAVDAVFANMYLHHIVEPPLALAEMRRILKPGGRLVLTDLDAHDHAWMREEMADVWLGFDRAQVRRWLEAAGFREVAVDCAGSNCCGESKGGDHAEISIFVAVGVK